MLAFLRIVDVMTSVQVVECARNVDGLCKTSGVPSWWRGPRADSHVTEDFFIVHHILMPFSRKFMGKLSLLQILRGANLVARAKGRASSHNSRVFHSGQHM